MSQFSITGRGLGGFVNDQVGPNTLDQEFGNISCSAVRVDQENQRAFGWMSESLISLTSNEPRTKALSTQSILIGGSPPFSEPRVQGGRFPVRCTHLSVPCDPGRNGRSAGESTDMGQIFVTVQ